MIGKVETINGVKQIVPLDDTLIPNISPATPNNSVLQYDNGVVKSAGYTASQVAMKADTIVKFDYTATPTGTPSNFITANLVDALNQLGAAIQTAGTYAGKLTYTGYWHSEYLLMYTSGPVLIAMGTVYGTNYPAQSWSARYDGTSWVAKMLDTGTQHFDLVANTSNSSLVVMIKEVLSNAGARYLPAGQMYTGTIQSTGKWYGTYTMNADTGYTIHGTISGYGIGFAGYFDGTNWQVSVDVKDYGSFEGMTLSQMYDLSQQNAYIAKGFLNWNDTRNPLYNNGANTGEVTCYDWNMVFEDIYGCIFYWDATHSQWVQSNKINQVDKYVCQPSGGAGYFNSAAPYQDDVTDTKYGDGRHHVTGLFVLGAGSVSGQGIWLRDIPRGDTYSGNSMWIPVFLADGNVCTALVGLGVPDPSQPAVYKGNVSIWGGGYAPTLAQNTTAFVDFWYQEQ